MTTAGGRIRAPRNVLGHVINKPWLIAEEGLWNILAVADRSNLTPEMISKIEGQEIEYTSHPAEITDGVATIHIKGPMFRYANLMTRFSGATSMRLFARDFTRLMNDRQVRALIVDIDSPGGEANGISELSQMLYLARDQKPNAAYISGDGASAAYWLASSMSRVIAGDLSPVGSIGVRAVIPIADGEEEIVMVSRQSPRKGMDPLTEQGRNDVQTMLDDMASVFISAVARNRGISTEDVLNNYGQGAVFVGAKALEAGLVDSIMTYDALHAEMVEKVSGRRVLPFSIQTPLRQVDDGAAANNSSSTIHLEEDDMATEATPKTSAGKETPPTVVASDPPASATPAEAASAATATVDTSVDARIARAREEGAATERTRQASLDDVPGGDRHPELLAQAKKDSTMTAEKLALQILKAEQTTRVNRVTGRRTDEAELDAPGIDAGAPATTPAGNGDKGLVASARKQGIVVDDAPAAGRK